MALTHDLTQTYQDNLHRPAFPYKFKIKCSGCPNDCVASVARADLSIIGTWRDDIRIDQAAVKEYETGGLNIERDVCGRCPSRCMEWNGKLTIDNRSCVRCMHCINAMPKALRPGTDVGAIVLIGSKAPIVNGALLSSVLVPFMKVEPPYQELKELLEKIWEWWDENGKNRERIGELIQRMGMRVFLEAIGLDPQPDMVFHPRTNPYVFYDEYFEAAEEEAPPQG
jgi:sulfite reductase alpha subunit